MRHTDQDFEMTLVDAYLKCAARLHRAALVSDAGSERSEQSKTPDTAGIALAAAGAQAAHMIADLLYAASSSVARGQREATLSLLAAIRSAVSDADARLKQMSDSLGRDGGGRSAVVKEIRAAIKKAERVVAI